METISIEAGLRFTLDSLLADRLCLLAGAGLSMAPPSSIPSAAAVADGAKRKYAAIHGATRPPLPDMVDDQAEMFYRQGELATVYFRTLIDPNVFAGQPNEGHIATADLLLVRAIQTAVTTNVDNLVETAGNLLHGTIGVGIDGETMYRLAPDRAPLLKIHGCHVIDSVNMVWARGQLADEPVSGRVDSGARWLEGRLKDRDLLIVGYWTDWDYLNGVLESALGVISPARIIVIDPQDASQFSVKAKTLYDLGNRATTAFQHVQASGDVFLDSLRRAFSESFVRQVLHSGVAAFEAAAGRAPDAALTEPPVVDCDSLWRIRRDLEGRLPHEPAKERVAPQDELLGMTILQLRSAGALAEGAYWILAGKRIRVIRTANVMLHTIQAKFEREMAPAVSPDLVIAVGAEGQLLQANIARANVTTSIARGSPSRWLNRTDALSELGL